MSVETMPDFLISPTQGVQLMAIAEMLRSGELEFKLDGEGESATAALLDVAQELALQISTTEPNDG